MFVFIYEITGIAASGLMELNDLWVILDDNIPQFQISSRSIQPFWCEGITKKYTNFLTTQSILVVIYNRGFPYRVVFIDTKV